MSPRRALWRSLEAALADPDFIARAAQEFPTLAELVQRPLDRRRALKLMGAALLLQGLEGCQSKFSADLIPAVRIPENIIPGRANFYATAHVLDGYATGVVVKHNMGRPVGIAGNPEHPASLGAIDAFSQGQLLELYDPDRAGEISRRGIPVDQRQLEAALTRLRAELASNRGEGFRILTGTVTSPTLLAQIDALLAAYPEGRWIAWDPVSRRAPREGSRLAYGQPLELIPQLDEVDVLLTLDSDLMGACPGWLAHARAFASRRNPVRSARMMRVYAIESTPTLIGSVADHRFIATPAEISDCARRLAAQIAAASAPSPSGAPPWLSAVQADLESAPGRALVHAGAQQPAEVHAMTHLINEALQGRGRTYRLITPPGTGLGAAPSDSLEALVADMHAGRVSSLVILDSNPCYSAPRSLGFARALERVPFSLALANYEDETARSSTWRVPRAHDFESWSDARAFDGTVSVLQPQALPLFGGLDAYYVLGLLLGPAPLGALEQVRATHARRLGGDEPGWRESLARGKVANTATPASTAPLRPSAALLQQTAGGGTAPLSSGAAVQADGRRLELLVRPDPSLWDGRYANNPWLQELPRPLTKIVWDNPLLIAPALAGEIGLKSGDLARLSVGTAHVTAPIWIMPGQSPACITGWLGGGRQAAGSVGNGHGVDLYALVGVRGPVSLSKAHGHVAIASTEHHQLLFGAPDDIIKVGTLEEFRAHPRLAQNVQPEPHLYRTVPPGPAAWAMSIDLNACIGCNACVVACQAENNVCVVGKEEVLREREMHWLRIDRYYEGTPAAPEAYFQPVLCMHCEQAPCENVCPVGATVHDSEGLNVMVYNRCVGTRFCSNNCPYKVRRFNFFGYAREQHRPAQSWNPDVTVRARGVMEKCNFCLQRIAEERIAADRESRPVGEIKTACQAACPTQAFTFGNLADPDSAVAARKRSALTFAMLEKQNTQPRTTYEALVRNPNPALSAKTS
jgi:molybdopterin-containing oxidoreductase family iron-sulfur binding subunit